MSICDRCGAPIEYRRTARGRAMPVDPGKVAVLTRRGGVVHGWVSHFCTCESRVCYLPEEFHIVQRRFLPT